MSGDHLNEVKPEEDDEEFEVVNVSDLNERWLQKTVQDLARATPAKQLAIGGASGWFAGYLAAKVGRAAAFAVGGGLLILQIANHQGYIKINWRKLRNSVERAKERVEQNANANAPRVLEKTKQFLKDNVYVAGGFAGGFLVGIAM